MIEKLNPGGNSATRKKYTPAFKAECIHQVAAGARQSDVARALGISPALLSRWQRSALEQAVPSTAERVLGQPAPTAPDQVWVGEITYLPLVGDRWCYLATQRNACSRRVVSWHLGRTDAHRTRVAGPGTRPGAASTRAGAHRARRPSPLGYRSPHQFEQELKSTLL